jgi:replication factor C subunit 2/4
MNNNSSWVEKYRPTKLSEITSQKDVVISLRKSLKTHNIPHLIFFGPSGCGKTSSILALSRELFGEKYFNSKIIELNASDERGINVVRDKIKTYAKHSVSNNSDGPGFKIIILDEADSMTPDSQFALRRIMEEYSSITRFCIICNYHNKIIDPIVSRCSLFRFNPISNDELIKKLKYISEKEKMKCSDKILRKIVKICRGDLRKGINFLQRCHNYFGDNINDKLLDDISGIINSEELKKLIMLSYNKESKKVDNIILKFYNDGYSLVNQILELHDIIVGSKKFSSIEKSNIIKKLVEIDQNLIKGCDEYIQFLRFCYYIMSLK